MRSVFRSSTRRGGQQFSYKVFEIFQCFSSPHHNKSSFILTFSVLRAFMVGEKKTRQNGAISPHFFASYVSIQNQTGMLSPYNPPCEKNHLHKISLINNPYRPLSQPSYKHTMLGFTSYLQRFEIIKQRDLLMPPMNKLLCYS